MFKILNQTFRTGIVTSDYPKKPAMVAQEFRGLPKIDYAAWRDARPAAAVCPTGAIACKDDGELRDVSVDFGLCIFCGLCAESGSDGAIRTTVEFELAVEQRKDLMVSAQYRLNVDGSHRELVTIHPGTTDAGISVEGVGRKLKERISSTFGHSLAIREVDAGSCNGCELEIHSLNNPTYDIERFGIHFVASPRHADMLLVTGPVTRNMEVALRKTYHATPSPKLVVATGTCGISGGIFGQNYASLGGVDQVIPVDVYIPGCPPRPQALLQGILLAIQRMPQVWPPVGSR